MCGAAPTRGAPRSVMPSAPEARVFIFMLYARLVQYA